MLSLPLMTPNSSVLTSYHPFCQSTHDILHPSSLNFNTPIGLLIPLHGVELDCDIEQIILLLQTLLSFSFLMGIKLDGTFLT